MFRHPKAGERAVLVDSAVYYDPESLTELRELAVSAGANPVAIVTGSRPSPDARFYVGRGKLDEVARTARESGADLVLFNNPLSPSQERNLEKELGVRVVDRTGLILDIFAQRAQSFEGKLQVELAQLKRLSTRLIRGWTHLERQKGGIGLRGPGETQLETDKRLIGKRISQIQKRLEKVEKQRSQGRIGRRRADLPVVGLVGYTNAGKSTLFNALTGAGVYAAEQLFATLDPTLRRVSLSPALTIIVADTVGFIRHLPHELVAAFRSTLQEAIEADLLLHVIDASDPRLDDTIAEVDRVLQDIRADGIPQMQVLNKIDKLEASMPHIERNRSGLPAKAWLSARTGAGCPLLLQALKEHFNGLMIRGSIHLPFSEAGLRARLYRVGRVLKDEADGKGGWNLEVEIPRGSAGCLRGIEGLGVKVS